MPSSDEQPFKCLECSQTFKMKCHLAKHQKRCKLDSLFKNNVRTVNGVVVNENGADEESSSLAPIIRDHEAPEVEPLATPSPEEKPEEKSAAVGSQPTTLIHMMAESMMISQPASTTDSSIPSTTSTRSLTVSLTRIMSNHHPPRESKHVSVTQEETVTCEDNRISKRVQPIKQEVIPAKKSLIFRNERARVWLYRCDANPPHIHTVRQDIVAALPAREQRAIEAGRYQLMDLKPGLPFTCPDSYLGRYPHLCLIENVDDNRCPHRYTMGNALAYKEACDDNIIVID